MQNYQDLEVHTDYLDLSKLKKIKFFNQQKQLSVQSKSNNSTFQRPLSSNIKNSYLNNRITYQQYIPPKPKIKPKQLWLYISKSLYKTNKENKPITLIDKYKKLLESEDPMKRCVRRDLSCDIHETTYTQFSFKKRQIESDIKRRRIFSAIDKQS